MYRDLVLVGLSILVWGIGEGMFLLFQPLYLEELGADPVMIGAIMGVIGLAMALGHLPAGFLADRIGRRPLMFAAWFIGLGAAWTMAMADTLPVFVLGSSIYGLTAFVISPLNSYATAARGKLSTSRVLTLVSAAYNLGALTGPILGGWIGQTYGLRSNFFVAAMIFILSTLLILTIRPQPVEAKISGTWWQDPGRIIQPRFIQYLAVIFLVMMFMYLPQPLSQNFMLNEKNISIAGIGALISMRSAGVVVLNLILGFFKAPFGFLLSQISVALYTLLIFKGNGLPWYLLGYFLLGGYQTARVLASAQSRKLVNASQMGLAYGAVETVISIAFIIAPPIAGYVYEINPDWLYMASFILICTAIAISLIFSPVRIRFNKQAIVKDGT
jgi:MFS family permease